MQVGAGLDLSGRQALIRALPPIRDALQAQNLWANKAFGQHFLLDLNLTERIVREARLSADCQVAEIGPGPGGLTRALLAADINRVVAIERDPRFVGFHEPLVAACEGFYSVIAADALTVDLTTLLGAPRAIVANLPYNVGTPMLIGWLRQAAEFQSMTLMFQREVADRIVAQPGRKTYGRLSVLAQLCCHASLVMTVPARAFTPPPKIDSAVVRLVPRTPVLSDAEFSAVERVTAAAFGQRRKMLRSALKNLFDDPVAVLEAINIDPTARAEDIGLDGFKALAHALPAAAPA